MGGLSRCDEAVSKSLLLFCNLVDLIGHLRYLIKQEPAIVGDILESVGEPLIVAIGLSHVPNEDPGDLVAVFARYSAIDLGILFSRVTDQDELAFRERF